ncbi:response regulator [Myxococcota bacterium]|nr:response regulator [Myxococcota bacterium]
MNEEKKTQIESHPLLDEKKASEPHVPIRLSFHTLNNHLAACRGYAELLARLPALPPEATEYSKQLSRALGDALVSAMALEQQAKERASEVPVADVGTKTPPKTEIGARASSDENQIACETLLIVEDDEAFREMLTNYLQRRGYTILAAQNGEEGITRIQQHLEDIDAVLLDRHMPRCDGLEFLEEMRRYAPRLRVVMLSGNDLEHERTILERYGVFSHLKKPFSLRVLSHTLRQLFAAPPPSPLLSPSNDE